MTSKEKLTKDVERRKAALKKLTAAGGKSTPEAVRSTRKQLKRAQRGLAKLARRAPAPPPAAEAAEEKKEEATG